MVYTGEAKKELRALLDESGRELISRTEETRQKRMTGLLLQRQAEALDILDCVEAKAETVYTGPLGEKKKSRAMAVLTHPALTLALPFAAAAVLLATGLTGLWGIVSIGVIAVLMIQAVLRLAAEKKDAEPKIEARAEAGLNIERARRQIDHMVKQVEIDTQEMSAAFAPRDGEQLKRLGRDTVRIFNYLYEAKLDDPQARELDEPLSQTRLLMSKMGLATVEYGPETRKFFTVERAEYPSQTRRPAVIMEKTGEVMSLGERIEDSRAAAAQG